MRAYCDEPRLAADGTLDHAPGIAQSPDETVVRPASAPFEAKGGLRLLRGNLGSALIKLSAVKPEFRSITAPAVVVDAPQLLNRLHAAGLLPRAFVAVLRYQGPCANGTPELTSVAPLLGRQYGRGSWRAGWVAPV